MPLLPAISCLGAFQTPAARACGDLLTAGVRKPAQKRTFARERRRRPYRPIFGHSQFGGSAAGGILRERTERDGFDRERGLNPYLWTLYGEPYPGA